MFASELPREAPVQPRRSTLPAQGLRLHAESWLGGQQRILLLHGLGGNTITWHAVGQELARQHRARVTAVDLPGFGASHPMGKQLSMDLLNRVVDDVVDALCPGGEPIALVGNSLGGVLSLTCAERRPRQVAWVGLAALSLPLLWGRSRATLAGLAGIGTTAMPWLGRGLITRYVLRTGVPGVVDDPVRQLFFDATTLHPAIRERLIAVSRFRLGWAHEAARAYEQTARSTGVFLLSASRGRASWLSCPCPVTSIRGTHDPLFPEAAWQVLQRQCPDWRHVCLEDVAHVPQLEAPTRFVQALSSSLPTVA